MKPNFCIFAFYMKPLEYTIIKNREQYDKYCDILENLVLSENESVQDEIELLNLLIEKWDSENNSLMTLDPIELLKVLMIENNLKAKDLIKILHLSKGTVSKILNYQKTLSENLQVISKSLRRLSTDHID